MFERFTNTARRAVVLSQSEARTLEQSFVAPHHLLLGLLTAENATGAEVLASFGVEPSAVRYDAVERYGHADGDLPGHIPFADDCKAVLERSLRESLTLTHTYIGSEHILLGLIGDASNDAADFLHAVGVDIDAVRAAVMTRLGSASGAEPAEP